jgi:hypothetical protein
MIFNECLKSIQPKNINIFAYVMLELRLYFKDVKKYVRDGKCYKICYITEFHNKVLKAKKVFSIPDKYLYYDYSNKKDDIYKIKYRRVYKCMDYQKSQKYYYDATNLKYWNSTTKKTSNKNLKAIDIYTYKVGKDKRKTGWHFGGIKSVDIQHFCIKNGLDKIIAKTYLYGDFGNWILHTLE